jgi:hypothetical protein
MNDLECPDCKIPVHVVYDALDDTVHYKCDKCNGKYALVVLKTELQLLHPKECIIVPWSSRICEKGTYCCTVYHQKEYEKKLVDTHKDHTDHICKHCGQVWHNCVCSHEED